MIRVRQIKIRVEDFNLNNLRNEASNKTHINQTDIVNLDIIKQSIDARDKNQIYYVFEVNLTVKDEAAVLKKNKSNDIFISPNLAYDYKPNGSLLLTEPIVVVGSGPAGLFCAYNLIRFGYPVIIVERGADVDERINKINMYHASGNLDPECNVQFGAGGAGTFSDGKLNTLVKDENNRGRFVFETFIQNGANPEILYDFHPHIGTDVLQDIIKNMTKSIINMGGIIRYNTKLTDIIINDNEVTGIVVNNGEVINTRNVVLAIGHSARDTYEMLYQRQLKMVPKPLAIGLRVIHPQALINESQYGGKYANILPPATYKLTNQCSNGRGVYSFCMCPGGYVVNSSSELEHVCVNGMSYSKRDGENANSAIVVTISPDDFGTSPMDGIEYLRTIEAATYNAGNGKVPVQLLKDYYQDQISTKFGSVNPTIKGDYQFANINDILPEYINNSIKESFISFGNKIKGFNNDDVILCASETRTSSPIRIIRDEAYEGNFKGIYPCGEGAGYSGGIITSAIDGLKISEIIMNKYKKC